MWETAPEGVCNVASASPSRAVAAGASDVGSPAGGGPASEGAEIRTRLLALLREEEDFLEASLKAATSSVAAMTLCEGERFLRLALICLGNN